jgi:uncharacterized cofD-like protein
MKKVVAIGGGSGLATLLRALRDYPIEITAVVTMTDDGASTGRLRKSFDILPPGDIRQCIAALSSNEDLLLELFQYRFRQGAGIKGHSLGNLFISAARDVYGNFESAIEGMCELFSIKGQVLPSTLENIELMAEFDNGKKVRGESKITKAGYSRKIKRVFLNRRAKSNKKAIEAIKTADFILIGPGSLYTSILPNFLLPKILSSYQKSRASKIYICNVSTERGETDNFSVSDHIKTLNQYGIFFERALINDKKFKKRLGDGYIIPVVIDQNLSDGHLGDVVAKDLVDKKNPLYHDIDKLGKEIWSLLLKRRKGSLF